MRLFDAHEIMASAVEALRGLRREKSSTYGITRSVYAREAPEAEVV